MGTAAAAVYAAQMIEAAWDGLADEETWGLAHLPMQAACGLAVAGSAVVALIATTSRDRGSRMAVLPPSAAAVWMGTISSAYPNHLGSLGRLGGIAASIWGLAFAAVVIVTSGRRAGR